VERRRTAFRYLSERHAGMGFRNCSRIPRRWARIANLPSRDGGDFLRIASDLWNHFGDKIAASAQCEPGQKKRSFTSRFRVGVSSDRAVDEVAPRPEKFEPSTRSDAMAASASGRIRDTSRGK
jgi:hypothetical protein